MLAPWPVAASPLAQVSTRVRWGRVEVEGPLERLELTFPDGGATRLELQLGSTESRLLELPLAPPAVAFDRTPDVAASGGGRARFVGWVVDDLERLSAQWNALPTGLRQRPRPPAPDRLKGTRPPLAALLLVTAAFLLGMRWRRRSLVALGIGTAGAAAALALTAAAAAPQQVLRLLEGDGQSGRWIAVRAARERLPLAGWGQARVATAPDGAPLAVNGAARGDGSLRWTLEAPRTTLYLTEVLEWAPDTLTRDGPNRLGALARTWVRASDGTWTAHGPWPAGQMLPVELPGPGEPPGWLNPALPLGTGILVGELADELSDPGDARDGAVRTRTWVRVVGF